VGAQSCSAETTFACDQETGEPSRASRLLRLFHKRPIILSSPSPAAYTTAATTTTATAATTTITNKDKAATIHDIPITRSVVVGKGATRRANVNDVDLNHPLIAAAYQESSNNRSNSNSSRGGGGGGGGGGGDVPPLVMEYGNPALDFLQSYVDSLCELSRMDDGRLGIHFFEEYRANIFIGAGKQPPKVIRKKAVISKDDDDDDADEEGGGGEEEENIEQPPRKRSRRSASPTPNKITLKLSVKRQGPPPPLGALSLNNCAIGDETIHAMIDSGMGLHLAVLDLGGIYTLSDSILEQLLPHCPHLKRLSLKNCRRITSTSLDIVAQYQTKLQFLDVGGTYNMTPIQVLEAVVIGRRSNNSNNHNRNGSSMRSTTKPCPELKEFHASGLGWNDALVKSLIQGTHPMDASTSTNDDNDGASGDDYTPSTTNIRPWKALSFGFSYNLSALALRLCLSQVSSTLTSLALHFCENVVDNALMGILGRNLPNVKYLDVRGNPSLSSMTGWYDGRASADLHMAKHHDDNYNNDNDYNRNNEEGEHGALMQEDGGEQDGTAPAQELIVLARFTGISKASLEDTLRAHPLQASKLTVVLDGGGHGLGIYR